MPSALLPVDQEPQPCPVLLQAAAVDLPDPAAGLPLRCEEPSVAGAWAEALVLVCWCCAVTAPYGIRVLEIL